MLILKRERKEKTRKKRERSILIGRAGREGLESVRIFLEYCICIIASFPLGAGR